MRSHAHAVLSPDADHGTSHDRRNQSAGADPASSPAGRSELWDPPSCALLSLGRLALTDPLASTSAQGISALLDAEKEAAKIVQKARECPSPSLSRVPIPSPPTSADAGRSDRNQRIKDARGEATKEIEELKAKKDAQFKEFESHVRLLLLAGPAEAPSADPLPHTVSSTRATVRPRRESSTSRPRTRSSRSRRRLRRTRPASSRTCSSASSRSSPRRTGTTRSRAWLPEAGSPGSQSDLEGRLINLSCAQLGLLF